MAKKTETVIMEFLKQQFGILIAEVLLDQSLRKMGYKSINNLSHKEKIMVGQRIVEDIYSRFYPKDIVEHKKLLYHLHFSLDEAGNKIQEMIKKDCLMSIEPPKEVDLADMQNAMDIINNEVDMKIIFEWSSELDGVLMLSLRKENAVNIAKAFMEGMAGMVPADDELDEMKQSSIQEFFNIILPVFTKTVGDAFNLRLLFAPIGVEKFRQKYFSGPEFIKPDKMISTKISVRIGKAENHGDVLVFIKQATGGVASLLDKADQHNDAFEQSPPRLLVRLSNNIRYDLELFFRMLNLPPTRIDDILKAIYRDDLNHMSPYDVVAFYQTMVSNYLIGASKNKKQTVKFNLEKIIRINKTESLSIRPE